MPPASHAYAHPFALETLSPISLRIFLVGRATITPHWWNGQLYDTFWRFYRNGQNGATLRVPPHDGERPAQSPNERAGPALRPQPGETHAETGGEGERSEGREDVYPLQAGRLYLVPAGVRCRSRCTEAIDHFYIHFDIIGLPGRLLRQVFTAPVALPSSRALTTLAEVALEEVDAQTPPDNALHYALQGLLCVGFAAYLRALPQGRRAELGRSAEALAPVRAALDYIDERLADSLSNAQLADLCGLQRDTFIRRFHTCAGQTPAQYILDRRVTAAAQRLLFSNQSLDQIAGDVGFTNRAYLSRVFTQRLGMPPAAYRKAFRG